MYHYQRLQLVVRSGTVAVAASAGGNTYDMIHVTPPQSAPDFLRHSPLAADTGWVSVHKHTLQHTTYPDVWELAPRPGGRP
jgi:hypothetical protein